MKNPFDYKKEAELESYKYFDTHIRSLPKTADGRIDTSQLGFADNDVDAFRHTYVSGRFVHIYNDRISMLLGWLNEMIFPSSSNGRNMDLWNNAVGRQLAKKFKNKESFVKAVHDALKNGNLITKPGDSRIYEGVCLPKPAGNSSVVVLEQDKLGRNSLFFDFNGGQTLTKDEFVIAIREGRYPGYSIRQKKGILFPAAKRNASASDNLG